MREGPVDKGQKKIVIARSLATKQSHSGTRDPFYAPPGFAASCATLGMTLDVIASPSWGEAIAFTETES